MKPQSMSWYLFVSNGICKHLIKSLKSVISNPVYRQITSAALPRRIHPSQAAIFQILLSSGKRSLPVLHQKSFCWGYTLKISFLCSHIEYRENQKLWAIFFFTPLRLRSAAIQCLGVFENHRPHYWYWIPLYNSCHCPD